MDLERGQVVTSANGDSSRGSWEEKEFDCGDLGLSTTPKPVSPEKLRQRRSRSKPQVSQNPQVLQLRSNAGDGSKAFFDLNKDSQSGSELVLQSQLWNL